jgi:hypothetical protein
LSAPKSRARCSLGDFTKSGASRTTRSLSGASSWSPGDDGVSFDRLLIIGNADGRAECQPFVISNGYDNAIRLGSDRPASDVKMVRPQDKLTLTFAVSLIREPRLEAALYGPVGIEPIAPRAATSRKRGHLWQRTLGKDLPTSLFTTGCHWSHQ